MLLLKFEHRRRNSQQIYLKWMDICACATTHIVGKVALFQWENNVDAQGLPST